jgi:Na+-transporting NADH:ubiquinone oxidoreductase subunit A
LLPTEYNSIKPKLLVNEGSSVKGGEAVFINKKDPGVKFVSPVPGKIQEIRYGARRSIESIIIAPDWGGDYIDHGVHSSDSLGRLSREAALSYLKDSGVFPYIRQRPFDKIPVSDRSPKSIFINGMNSSPNAGDISFMVKDTSSELQQGIDLLKKLTDGRIHLCYSSDRSSDIFSGLAGVEHHRFSGPHPSGLVSTHIHFIDPINKGDIVWYLDATHLASIGSLLKTGKYSFRKTVCVSGSGLSEGRYLETCQGASVSSVLDGVLLSGEQRIINGTVLYGTSLDIQGHLGFYESNVQVIPEGGKRRLLGWAMPGFTLFSASSRAFVSSLFSGREWSFTTSLNGAHRSIVWTDVYDDVMPLGILTNFLVKAILADEIDEVESLGIYEVSDEDFALATYLCPSKTDISSIIRRGLDTLEKEGY